MTTELKAQDGQEVGSSELLAAITLTLVILKATRRRATKEGTKHLAEECWWEINHMDAMQKRELERLAANADISGGRDGGKS
jgi:hypothetical protein